MIEVIRWLAIPVAFCMGLLAEGVLCAAGRELPEREEDE